MEEKGKTLRIKKNKTRINHPDSKKWIILIMITVLASDTAIDTALNAAVCNDKYTGR